MNKRYLHHLWTRLRPIKTWYFVLVFLLCAVTSAFALRSNYVTMTKLRTAVFVADEKNADVVGALNDLRAFVNGHMNTDLTTGTIYPPIHLTHTFERLKKAEQKRVEEASTKVYTEAQQQCERLHPGSVSGGPRVPCIQQYVKDHVTTATPVPEALYKFSFASPTWSPDLAGWSLAAAGLFALLAVVRFILGRLLEAYTR